MPWPPVSSGFFSDLLAKCRLSCKSRKFSSVFLEHRKVGQLLVSKPFHTLVFGAVFRLDVVEGKESWKFEGSRLVVG